MEFKCSLSCRNKEPVCSAFFNISIFYLAGRKEGRTVIPNSCFQQKTNIELISLTKTSAIWQKGVVCKRIYKFLQAAQFMPWKYWQQNRCFYLIFPFAFHTDQDHCNAVLWQMLPEKDFHSWVLRAAGFRAASTKDEILSISRSHCSSHQAQDPQHLAGDTS